MEIGSNVANTYSVNVIDFATSATVCGNNLVITAAGGCTGSVYYTTNTSLTGSINVTNSIIVTNGVDLTTMGYDLIATNAVDIQAGGKIDTGKQTNGGFSRNRYTLRWSRLRKH